MASDTIETPEDVAATIEAALKHVPKERLIAGTNCGMAPMRRDIAAAKLDALGRGAALARNVRLELDQNTARPLENLLSVAHCLSALALASSLSSPRPLRIFAAVGDGVDEFAAGTLRCPGHQLLQLDLPRAQGQRCVLSISWQVYMLYLPGEVKAEAAVRSLIVPQPARPAASTKAAAATRASRRGAHTVRSRARRRRHRLFAAAPPNPQSDGSAIAIAPQYRTKVKNPGRNRACGRTPRFRAIGPAFRALRRGQACRPCAMICSPPSIPTTRPGDHR